MNSATKDQVILFDYPPEHAYLDVANASYRQEVDHFSSMIDYHCQRARYWESRCRFAVDTFQSAIDNDWDEFGEASAALQQIGVLNPKDGLSDKHLVGHIRHPISEKVPIRPLGEARSPDPVLTVTTTGGLNPVGFPSAEQQLAWSKIETNELRTQYEELRRLIDGGTESMTHSDAVASLKEVNRIIDELSGTIKILQRVTHA